MSKTATYRYEVGSDGYGVIEHVAKFKEAKTVAGNWVKRENKPAYIFDRMAHKDKLKPNGDELRSASRQLYTENAMSNDKATEIIEQLEIKTAEAQNTLNEMKRLLGGEQSDDDTRPTQPVIRVDSLQRKLSVMDGE